MTIAFILAIEYLIIFGLITIGKIIFSSFFRVLFLEIRTQDLQISFLILRSFSTVEILIGLVYSTKIFSKLLKLFIIFIKIK